MANKMPSMLALLGLLAVAGYQNRDKIAEAIKRLQNETPSDAPEGDGGMLGGILGAAAGSGGLTGGLADLMNSFRNAGQAEVADSWVTPGVPTRGLTPEQVEQAVGTENLHELSIRTGLSRDELLQRLSTAIPENVDRLTPDGKFPTEDDAREYFVSGGA
jgi:uncharacterized protein YidB (DUF937 family)